MARLNDDAIRVLAAAASAGIPFYAQKLIAAQAMHETGNFTSNVYRQNNNAFGMKIPNVRKSPYILGAGTSAPASEGSTPYAKYSSVEDSVKDVLHLYAYNGIRWGQLDSPTAFGAWLKQKSYYGASQQAYSAALQRWMETMTDIIEPVTITGSKKKMGSIDFVCSGCGAIHVIDLFTYKKET